jgi:hypothetical protein
MTSTLILYMMADEFSLRHECEISMPGFPLRWVSLLDFFDPELPGFPLKSIHFIHGGQRVFGVPISHSVERRHGEECTLRVRILSNVNLSDNTRLNELFGNEMRERLGLSEAMTLERLKECCRSPDGTRSERHKKWERIVELIFPRLEKYYGSKIPCGQFYPELYGIVRFVAAWNTPGGRKQEYIMISNVLQTIGKRVGSPPAGECINLWLLPTYDELLAGRYDDFESFLNFRRALMEYGNKHLTKEFALQEQTMYLLDAEKGIPNKEGSWDALMEPLSARTRQLITQIKEDFNRNYQRPFVFLTYFYNLFKGFDFRRLTLQDYAGIYEDPPRGIYPKVLGCFLQQAFKRYDCIPVDTWVTSFFEELFQTPAEEIPTSGNNLGKFERLIWNSAQLRKTNQPFFNDILFCVKTGILHSEDLQNRKPNPLSCSLCSMRRGCPTFQDIRDKKVFVVDQKSLSSERNEGSINLMKPETNTSVPISQYLETKGMPFGALPELSFIITSRQGIAREVYFPLGKDKLRWYLTDDMSSFSANKTVKNGVFSVGKFNVDSV